MKYLRRLRAFCECLPILMAGWSLELQDWEFIDKTHSLGWWKQRFKLIVKDKNFIE
jgi:hypothetical protein